MLLKAEVKSGHWHLPRWAFVGWRRLARDSSAQTGASNHAPRIHRPRAGGHQADAAEQAARCPACERPPCPERHLLGLAIGAPWRDLPQAFGPYTTCYNRFVRWRHAGARQRCLAHRMRNLAAKLPEDVWPEFKVRAQASYHAPSRAIARELAAGLVASAVRVTIAARSTWASFDTRTLAHADRSNIQAGTSSQRSASQPFRLQ